MHVQMPWGSRTIWGDSVVLISVTSGWRNIWHSKCSVDMKEYIPFMAPFLTLMVKSLDKLRFGLWGLSNVLSLHYLGLVGLYSPKPKNFR